MLEGLIKHSSKFFSPDTGVSNNPKINADQKNKEDSRIAILQQEIRNLEAQLETVAGSANSEIYRKIKERKAIIKRLKSQKK